MPRRSVCNRARRIGVALICPRMPSPGTTRRQGEMFWAQGDQINLGELFDELSVPDGHRDAVTERLACGTCSITAPTGRSSSTGQPPAGRKLDRSCDRWTSRPFASRPGPPKARRNAEVDQIRLGVRLFRSQAARVALAKATRSTASRSDMATKPSDATSGPISSMSPSRASCDRRNDGAHSATR